MKIVLVFLLLSHIGFSQGKIKVESNDISGMEFTLYKVVKKKATELNPETDLLEVDDRIQLQITVKLKDGTTLTSPLKGNKEGLQMKQFDYEFSSTTPAIAGGGIALTLLKAAAIPRGTFDVTDGYSSNKEKGLIGVSISVWHEDDVDKKYHYFMPVKRPGAKPWRISYTGLNTNIEVSVDETYPDYPLAVKISCPGKPEIGGFWRINPLTESITILSNGYYGSDGYGTTSDARGGHGSDGGSGGNSRIVFVGAAKQFEGVVMTENRGGRGGNGGKGYSGYGPAGRDGRDGAVTVSYK